jgi:2,3-bisphosphoglycerate-independent phosphoglycerate mutase
MDRYEADWAVVERGWRAHVLGEGRLFASAADAVRCFRSEHEGIGDQYLPPFVVQSAQGGSALATIEDGDGVVFFNFRGDRALEISRAFLEDESWSGFDRVRRPDVRFAGMMQYDGDLLLPPRFLVDPPEIDRSLSEFLTVAGVSQFACAETQKFGHVTYFWNGNRSGVFDDALEKHLEIPSDLLPFDQAPWMKAREVTDAVIEQLRSDSSPGLIRVNYANGDMVGHTGVLDATVTAVEAVDQCLARLLPEIERVSGAALITADHGNADQMFRIDSSGDYVAAPLTAHTLNRVPLYLFDPLGKGQLAARPEAGLANVAATALALLGFDKPEDYAQSLLIP